FSVLSAALFFMILFFFFFFSSRRRHTRFSRDWSSDVCSSDLENTQLDVIKMFEESESLFNFYHPLISTKTTREDNPVNNVLIRDFSIAHIFYDDTNVIGYVSPMLILNSRNSKVSSIKINDILTQRDIDGERRASLGLAVCFSEDLIIERNV